MTKLAINTPVLVKNRDARVNKSAQDEAGIVTFVHSNGDVNIAGFDAHGHPFQLVSVPFLQTGGTAPSSVYVVADPNAYQAPSTLAAAKQTGDAPFSDASKPVTGAPLSDPPAPVASKPASKASTTA